MENSLDLRSLPLPPACSQNDSDDYKNVEIDSGTAEFLEPLVELSRYGIRCASFYGDGSGMNAPLYGPFDSGLKQVYARLSVARKLRQVNKLLAKYGAALVVIDGFRPITVQADLWEWMLNQSKERFPSGTKADWEAYALRYASNPIDFDAANPLTWPTHSTGGAVDLTLEEKVTGKRLFMGSVYLDSSDLSSTRYFEDEQGGNESASHREAKRNRRLLFWAMSSVGFVNYPFEWWHFDYLTQAAVMNQGMPAGVKASYGLANRGVSPEV